MKTSLASISLVLLSLLFSICASLDTRTEQSKHANCTVFDEQRGEYYDLRPLVRGRDNSKDGDSYYEVDGFDTGYKFRLNVCDSLSNSTNDPQVSSQWLRNGHEGSLGKPSDRPYLRGKKLLLDYVDGDACPQNSRLKQSTTISFVCNRSIRGPGELVFVTEWDHCSFMFEWHTQYACPRKTLETAPGNNGGPNNDGNTEDTSHGAVAFVAVFLVGSLYILGGFLYNRVFNNNRGLRGLEQLPNYQFWHSIYMFIKRAALAAVSGVGYIVDTVIGCGGFNRHGPINIDSEEYNARNELFDNEDDDDIAGATVLNIR